MGNRHASRHSPANFKLIDIDQLLSGGQLGILNRNGFEYENETVTCEA
jgi:hypothetical protein